MKIPFEALILFLLVSSIKADWCINTPDIPFADLIAVGTYSPSAISTDKSICSNECFGAGLKYSAIWKGSYCFGLNDLTGTTNMTNTVNCTASDGISVFESAPSDVTLIFDLTSVSYQYLVGEDAKIVNPQILYVFPPGVSVGFKYGYEDRYGITESSSDTTEIKRIIVAPGTYEIQAQAVKQGSQLKLGEVAKRFLVYQQISNINLTCQPVALIYTPANCTLTMTTGSQIDGTIVVDGNVIETITLPDIQWERAGSVPNFFGNDFITGFSKPGIHIVNALFQYEGTVSYIEINAKQTGTVDLLLVRPDCKSPSTYCFASASCSAEVSCSRRLTCSSNYCPLTRSCTENCNNRLMNAEKVTILPVDYVIDKTVSYNIAATGYQIVKLTTPWAVKSGYRLAFHSQTLGDVISTTSVRQRESTDFFSNSHTTSVDTTLKANTFAAINAVHQISAMTQPPIRAIFKLMFNITGKKNVVFNLKTLDKALVTQTSSILVGLNINDTSGLYPAFALTNYSYAFIMNPHTGDLLQYYWNFGDGNFLNTTTGMINYTYTQRGVYNASIIVYNMVTSKTQYVLLTVKDIVKIDFFNGTISSNTNVNVNFKLSIISGSDFNCTFSGDGITNVTKPSTDLAFSAQWPEDGYYNVRIYCYNELSNDLKQWTQVILSNISGLSFPVLGGPVNEITQQAFVWLTGSNITFTMLIDNITRATTHNVSTKRGISETFTITTLGIIIGVIRAHNLISDLILVGNLTYAERITNLQLIATPIFVANGSAINFNVRMDKGSAVYSVINYSDNNNTTFNSSVTSRWDNAYTVPYTFKDVGNYNVSINCSNIVNSQAAWVMVYVITNLGIYQLKTNSLYFKKSDNVQVYLQRSSGFVATMANITIDWKDGDVTTIPTSTFNETAVYNHQFKKNGLFNVTVNLQNPLNNFYYSVLLTVVTPIANVRCSHEPLNTWVGNSITFKVLADDGEGVTLTLSPGDGGSVPPKLVNMTQINTQNDFQYAYNAVNNYTYIIAACNVLGCMNCSNLVQIQYKINPDDFKLTTNGDLVYPSATIIATLTFTGKDFPTGLKATATFSDGSNPITVLLTKDLMPYQFSKLLTKIGSGTVSVKLENLISSANYTGKYGVYQKITGFDFDLSWGSSRSAGYGDKKDTFPFNQPLYFRPIGVTVENIVSFTLSYFRKDNPGDVSQNNVTLADGEIVYTFTIAGELSVTLKAVNPIDSASATKLITVGNSLRYTRITTTPEILLPNYFGYIHISWETISTESCICVDLGNGTKLIYGATTGCINCTGYSYTNIKPVQNKLRILACYTKEADYNVTVSVYSGMSPSITSQILPVTYVQCGLPVTSMTYLVYMNSYSPQTELRSNQIIVSALIIDLPCKITKQNFKLWTAVQVDPTTLDTIKTINLTSILTTNNTQLIIPPRFLDYGLYLFTFTVVMDKNITTYTFQSYNQTFLLVQKSPIVVRLTDGLMSTVTKGTQEQICFTPQTFSKDPDLDIQNFMNWNWIWACQQMNEILDTSRVVYPKPTDYNFPSPRKGCFGDGPGIINFTNNIYCFSGANLESGKNYTINLNATTIDTRKGSSKINIIAVAGIPPNISIQCLQPLLCKINEEGEYAYNEMTFNPSDALLLIANCNPPPGSSCNNGKWDLVILDPKVNQWVTLNVSELKATIRGSDSLQVSILPSFFKANTALKRLQFCYESVGLASNGKACIQFFINPLPSGITCILDKYTVMQLEKICCNCTYQPKIQYRIYINASGQMTTLGLSENGSFCSVIPYHINPQQYLVRATRIGEGFVDINVGDVKIQQLNTSALNSIINKLLVGTDLGLITAIAKGNLKEMAEVYLKYISLITVSNQEMSKELFGPLTNNTKSNLGGSSYIETGLNPGTLTIEGLPPPKREAYEISRNEKSLIIGNMTTGLYSMVPADIKSLHLISSVVASITKSFDCVNRKSQWELSNKLVHLANDLKKMQTNAPRDDLITIATNLLSANFENDAAANIQINNGIARDVKQSKEFYLDYDTNLESTNNAYVNVLDEDSATKWLTLEVNSGFQTKIAFGVGDQSQFTIETLTKIMRDVSVIDEEAIQLLTSHLHYFSAKRIVNDISNKAFDKGRSSVSLPDVCSTLSLSPGNCSNPNNPVGVEVIATPNNVRSYLSNTNNKGAPIPMNGDYLTVNLFLGNQGSETSTKPNGTGNFTVFVARDPVFSVPDFNYTEPNPEIQPSQMIPGTGTPFTGPQIFEQKLVVYQFQLTGKDQSVHFQLKSNFSTKCTQYLVVGRLGSPPKLATSPDGIIDPVNFTFWGMIPTHTRYCNVNATADQPDPFTFFVNNKLFTESKQIVLQTQPDYSQFLNTLFFGVRELTLPEWNKYTSDNRPPVPYPYSGQINNTFRVRIFSTGCYANSGKFQNSWDTSGCVVGPLTTTHRTHCICNHLTSFAGGWIVAPNTIDFNYVFSNFDFTKNITLFVTEIVIFLLFILIFIWARRQDIRDIEKIGVTPLPSNDLNDTYLYEILVDTSVRGNAGTKSNVYFILSGELDETDPRHLVDSKRSILKRGHVDRFLLAVPRPLGTLQYIRLWHDNSGKGKDASWYCNYFGVTDLQTKEKFNFLVNNWFAVEEEDGQIDRLIAVASVNELLNFEQVFGRKMKTNLSEDHLWLSIMARPPESRFTRVERVACCLLLLFLTMLTTCMFYQKEGPTKVGNNILTIGPFALTPKEVWTGLISNIIAFIPLFIIIELFRKSQLKQGHANKLKQVVEDHLQISIDQSENKGYQSSMATLVRNEEMESSRPNTPGSQSAGQINFVLSDEISESQRDQYDEDVKPKVIRKRLMPWWMRIFAWGFLIILLIVAVVFTTFYGIQFGDMACKKWISSMFISFFASVLLTQPIKVILLAIFFSLVCKKSSTINNIEFIDEEDELMNELGKRNGLMQNEEYLHNELYTAPVRPHRLNVQPPPKEELEKAREIRLKEVKMFDVFREILFYLIFFCTLLFVTYSFRDPHSYQLKSGLSKVFITPLNPTWQFTSITREEQFWTWALNVLVPGLRAPSWYNNQPPIYQRGFVADRNNRLIGYAILRQVRTKKDSCKVHDYVRRLIKNCYSSYNIFNQDEGVYGAQWQPVGGNVSARPEFTYTKQSALNGTPYIGRIGFYSGGGYVYQFRSNLSNLFKEISKLKDNHWIDFQTRAIFVEFTTYNPNINLFAINTYVLELPGSGGIWTTYRIEPANLLGLYSGGVKAFEIFAQVMYSIFIAVMIVKEIRNMIKQKWKYFNQFWNYCELFIIFGSFLTVAGFVYVTVATNAITEKFKQYKGKIYLNFNRVAFWNENLGYFVSLIVFVSTLKFIRVLRFNKRIGMLGAVLSYSGKDLRQFFIIFAIMFFAFVMVFYSLFMDSLYRYHTFLFATEASMQIALGKFAFLELYQKEPIFGPIVFSCYVLFIIFVLLNMFIAILTEAFAVVKADIELQGSDYELVKFIMTKFIMWTGINNTKLGKRLIKIGITDQVYKDIDNRHFMDKVDVFPEKVEQFLNQITRIMYDGKKPNNQNENQFSSILFEKPKPIVKGDDANYDFSRPVSAASNILRSRSKHQMTPIDK